MGVVVSLFDESGNMVRDWAAAGHTCYCYDIQNINPCKEIGLDGIHYRYGDLTKEDTLDEIAGLQPDILFGFPPCTDLAVSGARHFEAKRQADPAFQMKAIALAQVVPDIGDSLGIPWMFENPVSVLSTLYRKPDYIFHPYEFGGYLNADDQHPRFPDIIPARDAYPKKTCLWVGNGFVIPERKEVHVKEDFVHKRLGGKGARTKKIRSETARGFARAVFEANIQRIS